MQRSRRSRDWGRHLAAQHIWGISVGQEEEEWTPLICAHAAELAAGCASSSGTNTGVGFCYVFFCISLTVPVPPAKNTAPTLSRVQSHVCEKLCEAFYSRCESN